MDISSLGNTPIPGDSPCGENIRYEPEFEELQAEIDKLSSPSASGTVDWKKVEKTCIDILSSRSKDLLVAAYLAVALLNNRGGQGLILGTRLMNEIMNNFWDGMFPPKKRLKGRVRILEWWRDKVQQLVEHKAPLTFSSDEFQALAKDLEGIDTFLQEKLEESPSVLPLKRLLEQTAQIEKEEKEPQQAASKGPTRGDGVVRTKKWPHEIPSIEDMDGLKHALNAILGGMKKAASFLRERRPEDPLGYRLWRSAIWMTIQEPPPSENGRTKIPPPQPQLLSMLAGLEASGDWASLLNAAEARLAQFPLWLDLNLYTTRALGALGDQFSKAKEMVEIETAFLLRRLPGLKRLAFSNGMPFAGPATINWLGSLVQDDSLQQKVESYPEEVAPQGKAESSNTEALCQKAVKAVQAGEVTEALQVLQEGIDASRSKKARFEMVVCLVEILAGTKDSNLLLGHCEEILQDIDRFHMEEWEPELAFKGLKAVWHCYNAYKSPEKKRQAQEVLMRLARLNVARAMELLKG